MIDNIPIDRKVWIDQDTVVYLLRRYPHQDWAKGANAVAHHMPTAAAIVYDESGFELGRDTILHPDAPAIAERMSKDPRVLAAVRELFRRLK